MTTRSVETVVVGGGHSELLASDLLRQAGREHVVLERRPALGGGWQDRWDAFQLVGPNWTTSMATYAYAGDDPDGFMTRDELIAHWRAYAAAIDAPVELETDVTSLRSIADEPGPARFRLLTNRGSIDAREVIVAAGPCSRGRRLRSRRASSGPVGVRAHGWHECRGPLRGRNRRTSPATPPLVDPQPGEVGADQLS